MPPTRGISCLSLVLYGISQDPRYLSLFCWKIFQLENISELPKHLSRGPSREHLPEQMKNKIEVSQSTKPLSSHKDTAQGTQSSPLGAFLAFRCVFMVEGTEWIEPWVHHSSDHFSQAVPAKSTLNISLLNKGIFYLIQPLAKHFCQNIPASNLMENLYIPPAQRVREREKDRVVHSRSETHLKTLW